MERRLLLVFALTFLIILAFQPLLKKYGLQPSSPSQPQAQPSVLTPPPAATAVPAAAVPPAGTRQAKKPPPKGTQL